MHNLASIPQTPYQTLIIPCPDFDPIYQVILLENSNEWNPPPPGKRCVLKKRREQWLKSKRGETLYEKLHVSKKGGGWDLHPAGRDSIKRMKERRSHFRIVQNLMHGFIHTHTSFPFVLPSIPWLFPFLPTLPHHSPSTMIICHASSPEFSFAFTIYKV
jgi:hypothetical protein